MTAADAQCVTSDNALHDLLAQEIQKRVSLEVQLQDVRMYSAALEHRIAATKNTVEEVETTLLRELMVYKRGTLSETDAHIFKSTIRNALLHEVRESGDLVAYQRRHASQVSSLEKRCEQLMSQLEDKNEAMNTMEMRYSEAQRVASLEHEKEVKQLLQSISVLRSQLSACSGRRLLEKAGLTKDKITLLRESVEAMRTTVVDFQRYVGEGMTSRQRTGSFRGARTMSTTLGRRRSSVASPDRWRKQSTLTCAAVSFSPHGGRSAALSRTGSMMAKNASVHFTLDDDITTEHSTEVAGGVSEPQTVSPTSPLDTPQPAPRGKPRNIFSAGGLIAKSMKALEGVNGNYDVMSQRLEGTYKHLLALHEQISIQDERPHLLLAPMDEMLCVTSVSADLEQRVESYMRALLEVLSGYRTRAEDMNRTISSLQDQVSTLHVTCKELAAKIPPPVATADAGCLTVVDATNWEYLIQKEQHDQPGGTTTGHASPTALKDALMGIGGVVVAPVEHGVPGPGGSASSGPGSLRSATQMSPRASSTTLLPRGGVGTPTTHHSLSVDVDTPMVAQPVWALDPAELADNLNARSLKRSCLIQWLTKFHLRKQRSLQLFLQQRVAPVFGIHVDDLHAKRKLKRQPHQSSARHAPGGARSPQANAAKHSPSATITVTSHYADKSSEGCTPRPPPPPPPSHAVAAASERKHRPSATQSSFVRRPFSATVQLPLDKPDLDWIREGRLELGGSVARLL